MQKRTALNVAAVFYFLNEYRFEYGDEMRTVLKGFGTDDAALDEKDTPSISDRTPKGWIWPERSRSGETNSD